MIVLSWVWMFYVTRPGRHSSECLEIGKGSEMLTWEEKNWNKKKNRNWVFKVLHCLEISGSAPPEKPNVCRYKYFHMFLINFIGLWRALESDWEFLICAIFYELEIIWNHERKYWRNNKICLSKIPIHIRILIQIVCWKFQVF